jgi:hypothetical protein
MLPLWSISGHFLRRAIRKRNHKPRLRSRGQSALRGNVGRREQLNPVLTMLSELVPKANQTESQRTVKKTRPHIERQELQSLEMSLLVRSLSIAVASSVMIAHPRMNTAIGVAER